VSLIPEPPEIYRSGAWRRNDGLKVEPIFVLGGTTYKHDLYRDNSESKDVTTGFIQIIGGDQGIIATIDAWEYQPLPTLSRDIGVTEALATWNARGATASDTMTSSLVSSYSTQISTVCEFPAAFIDGDKLHILITRARVLFQSHTFHWEKHHGHTFEVIAEGTRTKRGVARSVTDALHIEVNLIDKSVTYAKQDCHSAALTVTSFNHPNYAFSVIDYELECSTQSIVEFLAERTGLDSAVFSVDHSPGAVWTYSANNHSGYPFFSGHWWTNWTDANSAELNYVFVHGPNVFMPFGELASHRKEYWADSFVNWPGWLGLNRDDGYVLAGDLSNRLVEISTFDSDEDQRYWGRSSLSDYTESTQLLDAEELFSIDHLDDDDQARITGAPRDRHNLPPSLAKQNVPPDWPGTWWVGASEPIDPQYFWSNAETLKHLIMSPAAVMVLYRVTD